MSDASNADRVTASLEDAQLACRRLFDEVPCYMSIQNRDLRVVEANRKMVEDFGDPVSKYCYAAYRGRSEPCPECPVVRTFESGSEHTSEETIFDRRGLPHNVVVNTRPLRDTNDTIVAVIELFTDISVQKDLERRLHETLTRFHNLFDVVPCYISVQDRDFRVVEANRHFMESFNGKIGGYCYEIYKNRESRCPRCPVAETFEDGNTHCSEEVLVDSSGKAINVVVHTAPVRDSQGKITAVMEVFDDITEIRVLQDKLASLGGIVSGIAHSIKNVLEGLRGGVYVVNIGFRDDNKEDLRTGWEMVERNVERLSSMIMDMLYCAKDRSPRQLPVSVPAIAGEVIKLFSARAGEYGIRLDGEISEDAGKILGEPKDIHSLISNLVGNAIDACLADESEDKTHRVVVRVFDESGRAVLEVEDCGAGMDEEARSKLFSGFYSTKGPYGTGLGLLVSNQVAAEHGGAISVKSAPGRGSTFTVRFPLESRDHDGNIKQGEEDTRRRR